MDKSQTRINDPTGGKVANLLELRDVLDGQLILPGDAGYDQARTLFYGGFDRRPAGVARVANPQDVARVIDFARKSGLEISVRSGGHSLAGHSVGEGSLLIDLRELRDLQIDPVARTAWVGTGLTAGEVTAAAGQHNLAIGFGDTGTVGIGGITLGGGVGFLARKFGLTIDNLLAAQVVTADGQILKVNPQNHPDLFWALRGGGGNFGVVTHFLYRLQPLDTVLGGMLVLPATPEVIEGFIRVAQAAPDELSTIANVMLAPPMPFLPSAAHGKMIVFVMLVYAGPPEEGEKVLAPLRALAEPLADMVRPMRYPEMFAAEEEGYHPTAVAHTMFLDRVDRPTSEKIIQYLQASDAPMRVAQLRVLGGAVERVPALETAYVHRAAPVMANLAAFFSGPEEKVRRAAWVADFARAIDQGNPAAYVNFLADEGPDRIRAAYPGGAWERLAQVKARYDPDNLFHLNQNIQPAACPG